MLRRIIQVVAIACALAGPARAQDDAADRLFAAMGLPQIVAVMRAEGLVYGEDIARDMFPAGPSPRWSAMLDTIYDQDRMVAEMRTAFAAAMEGRDLAPMLDFYTSDLGQQIVTLEISAREAMLDPAIDAAAQDLAAEAQAQDDPRYQLVGAFIAVNDLIERNVMGGLNANYAFVSHLISGGAALPGVTADSLLADIWLQEPEIRASTESWLYGFLLMAYAPLSDAEMQALVDFSGTAAGRDLTGALFVAFDSLFERVSRDLGSAASDFVISQDL